MKKAKFIKERKMVLLLLLFFFVLGAQYIFLTPPWQAPDETTHYEYIDILSRAKIFKIKQEPDHDLQEKIIKSMDQFNAWKYVYKRRPSPLPKIFALCPLYAASGPKVNRPPLYYILGSSVLRIFKTDNLLSKHYLIRLLSLFLSMFTVLFVFLAAKIVLNDDFYYSFTAACFVAFLPQFLIISSSISSHNLANLIGAFSVYVFLFSLKHVKNYYILTLFPLLVVLALLTGKTAFFIVPSLFAFSIIYFLKSWKRKKSNTLYITLVCISVFLIAYLLLSRTFTGLGTRLTTNILEYLRNCGRIFQKSYYADFNMNFIQILFKSHWYYSGWMAFRFPDYIYNILKIFSLFGLIGLGKYVYKKISLIKRRLSVKFDYFLLVVIFYLSILASLLCRLEFTEPPMARYLFPALSALTIIFVVGLKELIPFRYKKIMLMSLIFLFIILNIYALFNHMMNSFYFYFW